MIIDKTVASARSISRFATLEHDFNTVHEEKYTYTNAVFISMAKHKLQITCGVHGDFPQSAMNHVKGKGCPKCAQLVRNSKKSKGRKYFVEKAASIFSGKYTYDKVPENVTNRTKIVVNCPEHEEFTTTFNSHIDSKTECPACAYTALGIRSRLTTEEFIERSREVHNGKYSYAETVYVSQKHKVLITCPDHGNFLQLPSVHYFGKSGCPVCAGVGAFDLEAPATLYLIQFSTNNVYKLGITNNLKHRLSHYRDYALKDSYMFDQGKDAKTAEHTVLKTLDCSKYKGRRFIERGYTELLVGNTVETDVANILKLFFRDNIE